MSGVKKRRNGPLAALESHLCGCMIVLTFFGDQIKFLNLSLYVYALIFCLLLQPVTNNYRIRKPTLFKFSRVETFAYILIVLSTVTLPFSIGKLGPQPYFKTVVTALIMLVVANNIYDKKSFDLMFKYAAIGVAITVAICGYELLTGHHFYAKALLEDRLVRQGTNNSFGFQVNVNDNASLVSLSLFIALLGLRYKRRIKKLFFAAMAVALFIITSAIGARLPLLALAIVGVEALILFLISRFTKGNVSKVFMVLLVIFLCVVYAATFTVTGFLDTVSTAQNFTSDYNRILYIQWSLRTITPISFFFGNGAGMTQQLIGGDSIHSVLVEFLCDYGVLSLISLFYLLFKLELSFADRISFTSGIFFPCFATAFLLVSFCSSSMLRVRSVWVIIVIVWKYFLFKSEEHRVRKASAADPGKKPAASKTDTAKGTYL